MAVPDVRSDLRGRQHAALGGPVVRVDSIPPCYYVHRVRLAHEDDVDGELTAWLAEAREVGDQRHVSDPHGPKVRHPPEWIRVSRQVAEAIARGDDPSKLR